ncbi:hypothetical protein [Metabacillus fastidiosus]|uniref:hypothetical protein n=1 Tax=Metabacillus fastidiosus TaxID=1458 RepID=UPI003D2B9AAB
MSNSFELKFNTKELDKDVRCHYPNSRRGKVATRNGIKIEVAAYDYSHPYYVVTSDFLDDDIHVGIYVDPCKETAIEKAIEEYFIQIN